METDRQTYMKSPVLSEYIKMHIAHLQTNYNDAYLTRQCLCFD